MDIDNRLRRYASRLAADDPDELTLTDQLGLVYIAQALRRQLADERDVHHRLANESQNEMLVAELSVRHRMALVHAGDALAASAASDSVALAAWVSARAVE